MEFAQGLVWLLLALLTVVIGLHFSFLFIEGPRVKQLVRDQVSQLEQVDIHRHNPVSCPSCSTPSQQEISPPL